MELFQIPESLPPLPEYTLKPMPPLAPPIPDQIFVVAVPIVAYWVLSMFFHIIDVYDLFPQYRIHTPAELLKRNRVSRWEVVRDVLIQQVIQFGVGILLGVTEPDEMVGKEEYDIAVWARRIRTAERAIPGLLAPIGVNAPGLARKFEASHPLLSGLISGGSYASLQQAVTLPTGSTAMVPAHAPWEMLLAKIIYWALVPALQFAIGIVVVDTWQYFWHRAMHVNKWMYTTFHARHHRLYVPYAFGALYNHPFEGFLLDILGSGVAFKLAGMSTRQGMCFFTGSTFKTVDDHCGYSLPWDPLQRLTSNNAGYHDIHHQSFGIKTNFSQPFFTFWDRVMGTVWAGGDVTERYKRARIAAEKQFEKDQQEESNAAPQVEDSAVPEQKIEPRMSESAETRSTPRKGHRRRTASSLTQSDSLRGLRERVSIHGRAGGILGMEHSH